MADPLTFVYSFSYILQLQEQPVWLRVLKTLFGGIFKAAQCGNANLVKLICDRNFANKKTS